MKKKLKKIKTKDEKRKRKNNDLIFLKLDIKMSQSNGEIYICPWL